ncbi:uncharacterized protein LOC132563397 [Ylistrum balloti]|uniref:uncharacterized protein LOC132563397 n=1 Tax=Ylistrum balloti TaxID=509963 RepID=UPI002905A9D4|nr:uncharacterized protein LOC132563397 [Ylistrum balloti]
MAADSRLQKMLMSGEYSELEDKVLVEGAFIELDKRGDAIRQVLLGLTRDSFIVAKDVIKDYRKIPSVKYDADVDLDINDLEMEWIIPVCFLEITRIPHKRMLNILSRNGRHRYYMMTNIGGNAKKKWSAWMERVKYIHDDPYGYIKQLYNQWNDNFEIFDLEDRNGKNSTATVLPDIIDENMALASYKMRSTRAKSIVPENWHDILGIKTSSLDTEQVTGGKIDIDATKAKYSTDTNQKSKKWKKKLRFNLSTNKSYTCSCFR